MIMGEDCPTFSGECERDEEYGYKQHLADQAVQGMPVEYWLGVHDATDLALELLDRAIERGADPKEARAKLLGILCGATDMRRFWFMRRMRVDPSEMARTR